MNWSGLMLSAVLAASVSVMAWSDEGDNSSAVARASQAARRGQSAEAIRLATQAIKSGDAEAGAYYLRGREHFRLGKVRESLADFDRYVELQPNHASRLWERGITCYYAGKYAEGSKQFSEYQTFHGNDVENAVWHVLCNAKVDGFEAATKQLLPIRSDRRVPMMTIYALFRGAAMPDDVLRAARTGEATKAELNQRLFYAHLYLGLYHEARGDAELARGHIVKAAESHRIGHYMWDVANVHAKQLQQQTAAGSAK